MEHKRIKTVRDNRKIVRYSERAAGVASMSSGAKMTAWRHAPPAKIQSLPVTLLFNI